MKTLVPLLFLFISTFVQAQTNMAGRVYYNSNVLSGKMNEVKKDMNKELDKAKADAIKKAEENKNASSQMPKRPSWIKRPRKV